MANLKELAIKYWPEEVMGAGTVAALIGSVKSVELECVAYGMMMGLVFVIGSRWAAGKKAENEALGNALEEVMKKNNIKE